MKIILTSDVESYTGNYEREVYAEGRGLEFMLLGCRRHGIRGTFFVEALGATQWGLDNVREICRRVAADGHELALHTHPVVARLEGFQDRWDVMWEHDAATQERLLCEGLRVLRECGVRDVRSFRAGDLAADQNTLTAMTAAGITVGSNRDLDCKCSTRSRINDLFPVRNDIASLDGITDVPVTAFKSALPWLDGPYRHLEVAALGLGEMKDALKRAARAGYHAACVLTHPGEFYRYQRGRLRVVHKNCRRYEGLLQFISEHPDMEPVTLSETVDGWNGQPGAPREIMLNPVLSLSRVLAQGCDRVRSRLGF